MSNFERVFQVPIEKIQSDPNDGGLRPPKTDHPNFLQLVEDIRDLGHPLNDIIVRPPNHAGIYYIIDGHQRRAAAEIAGVKTLDVKIDNRPAENISFTQMIMNMTVIPTTKTEHANQLKRILARPEFTGVPVTDILARLKIKQTKQWLDNILRLDTLNDDIKQLVDSEIIPATNAYQLARLKPVDQILFVEDAKNDKTAIFTAKVNDHLDELKKKASGQTDATVDPLKNVRSRTLTQQKERYLQLQQQWMDEKNEQAKTLLAGQLAHAQWSLGIDQESLDQKKREKEAKAAEHAQKVERQKKIDELIRDQVKNLDVSKIKKVTIDTIE